MVSFINQLLGILTVVGQFTIICLFFIFLFRKSNNKRVGKIINYFKRYGLIAAFLVSLIATGGSLFYSEVAKYEPCKLCWFQRIFMYPQVVLLGMALLKRDKKIADYSIILSSIGALIALYHYNLQLGMSPLIPCSTVGYSVSCAQKFVMQFGYITIPMMAFTAFLLIIALMMWQKIKKRGLIVI